MADTPKVTVLMPVYNGETYLREAIESILGQTFTDFEFMIINDGSTDKCVEIIQSYPDSRIRLVKNEMNLGLIASLNKGIKLARGEYIARMDADDLSLPERLSRQVSLLEQRSEIGLCGCWWETIDEAGTKLFEQRHPPGPDDCRSLFFLFGEQPVGHPCIMFRRELVRGVGGYENEFRHAEDFRLWSRLAGNGVAMANLPEFLFRYRWHSAQVSSLHREQQRQSHNQALAEFLSDSLGFTVHTQEASWFRSLDFRPEELTSLDMLERLLELKYRSITHFYLSSVLPDSSRFGMNVEVTALLGANIGATTLTSRQALGMLYRFCCRLNRASFPASSASTKCTLSAMSSAIPRFLGSRLRANRG